MFKANRQRHWNNATTYEWLTLESIKVEPFGQLLLEALLLPKDVSDSNMKNRIIQTGNPIFYKKQTLETEQVIEIANALFDKGQYNSVMMCVRLNPVTFEFFDCVDEFEISFIEQNDEVESFLHKRYYKHTIQESNEELKLLSI